VAERAETELAEEQPCFIDGSYITSDTGSLINDSERYRAGE
jgi:hypothetical protein